MISTWCVWLVTDVYPPHCGGSGWSTHALARTLRDRGHRVKVILVDPSGTDVTTRYHDDISVTAVGLRAAHTVRRRLGKHDYAHAAIADYLHQRLSAEPDVDVLHAQHLHSTPPTVAVGRRHALATVATVRDYWPVCLHGTAWWASQVCEGCSTVNLSGCMSEYWDWPRPVSRIMVGWARRRLNARAIGLSVADKVLAVSEAVKRRIEGHLPHTDVSVVPNIVDPNHIAATATSWSSSDGRPFVLTAGKLQPTKGFHLLFKMLSEVSFGIRLLVAGDGPARSALESQAAALGLDATFLGWVDHDQLLGLQRDARAVILPSAWDEPLSRLVLETMGLGVPVVAWARGGNLEIIESGVTGWLVRTAEDLAVALEDLQSEDCRSRVGAAARMRLIECYSPDVVYPSVAAVYASAIENSKRQTGRGH